MPHIEGGICNVIMKNNDGEDVNIPIIVLSVDDLNIEYQTEYNVFDNTTSLNYH